MGYAYTGDKPSFNTNFNYEFPDKLTHENNEVVKQASKHKKASQTEV
jgi:hypothetical protein